MVRLQIKKSLIYSTPNNYCRNYVTYCQILSHFLMFCSCHKLAYHISHHILCNIWASNNALCGGLFLVWRFYCTSFVCLSACYVSSQRQQARAGTGGGAWGAPMATSTQIGGGASSMYSGAQQDNALYSSLCSTLYPVVCRNRGSTLRRWWTL